MQIHSSDLKSFRQKVYEIAQHIPKGKVATYGQIAKLVGSPAAARAVGMCMKQNTAPEIIPCHRIVSANGKLTGYAFGGVKAKKGILEKEGVHFLGNRVDLNKSLWELD